MRRFTLLAVGFALGLLAALSGGASATSPLRFRTAKGPITTSSHVFWVAKSLALKTTRWTIECHPNVSGEGELVDQPFFPNPGEIQFELESERKGVRQCVGEKGAPAKLEFSHFPVTAAFGIRGGVLIKRKTLRWILTSNPSLPEVRKCTYEAQKVALGYTVGGVVRPVATSQPFTINRSKSAIGCAATAALSAEYELISGGEPVESEA